LLLLCKKQRAALTENDGACCVVVCLLGCDLVGSGGKKISTKEKRWYKDVGLGYKTPAEAITGTYIGAQILLSETLDRLLTKRNVPADKKCPFTGDVSIRGRIMTGRVVSTKMTRTLVIRRDYLHYIPKYSTSQHCVAQSGI
jgi:hypothetical protein